MPTSSYAFGVSALHISEDSITRLVRTSFRNRRIRRDLPSVFATESKRERRLMLVLSRCPG